MKKYVLLAVAGVALVGCDHHDQDINGLVVKVGALEKEMAAIRSAQTNQVPLRVAVVDKSKVTHFLYQLQRDKAAEIKKADALALDVEAKISHYQSLQSQLSRMQTARSMRNMPRPMGYETVPTDEEYNAMVQKVAEAKAPIADIADRRSSLSEEFMAKFSVDDLIEEYAKGRYDVVIDSYSRDKLLYNKAGEMSDISDAVVAMVKERAKP